MVIAVFIFGLILREGNRFAARLAEVGLGRIVVADCLIAFTNKF